MTPDRGAAAPPGAGTTPAPSLARRMACFVYESMLLFGLGLVPGVLGALFFAQTGQQHPLQGATALRLFAWVFYGVYFVWFWSARGQTLAMQTWHIGLVTASGQRLTQRRALARYLACCIAWLAPPTLVAMALRLPPWLGLAATAAWIVVYALLALAEPDRQFWHDRCCGTRLIDTRGGTGPAWLRPRPR
jgi:uncharacterized RDD family membrane protein YckC